MTGLTGSGIQVDTTLDTEYRIDTTDGNHDLFSHYVTKEDMMRGMVYGDPVMALCGKIWVPSQDGARYPVCPTCKEIYNELPSENNEDNSDN